MYLAVMMLGGPRPPLITCFVRGMTCRASALKAVLCNLQKNESLPGPEAVHSFSRLIATPTVGDLNEPEPEPHGVLGKPSSGLGMQRLKQTL